MSESEPFVEPIAQIGKWVFGKMVGKEPKAEQSPVSNVFTDITFILDRSGSMGSLRQAAVDGINNYMRTVDEAPGDGCWSLVQFDDWDSARGAGEAFPHKVFSQVPSERRPFLELQAYQPRGGTALIDAVALTILETKARVEQQVPAELRKDYRVLMVIMTDGLENSSRQYNRAKLREMIAERQAAGWVFVFLGANQDAFAEAESYGYSQDAAQRNRYLGRVAANFAATREGLVGCTAAAGADARSWKVDGNNTATALQGSGLPDQGASGVTPE
jgi:hypothetical protein